MINRIFFNRNSSKLITYLLLFTSLLSLIPSNVSFAASDQLIITTDTYQMTTGTTFTVGVKAFISSTATPQTAVGSVHYPAGQLKVTATPTSDSGFGSPSLSQSSGSVSFNASRSSTTKGVVKIFDITFQAIGAGTAVVEFTGDSKVNNAVTTYKSAVFSITSPTPVSSPSTTPKPSSSPKPSVAPVPITSTTPTPTPSTDPDVVVLPTPDPNGIVTDVDVSPNYTSGKITWKVNASNPTSTVSYGSKSSDLSKQAAVSKNTDGTFSTTVNSLAPGERYYFTITGSGDGNKTGTYSSTLTTSGFPVTIIVTENGTVASGAQVRVNNVTRTTNGDGKTTLGLAEGSYTGKITTSTATLDITLTVAKKTIPSDGSSPETQSFTFDLKSSALDQGSGSGTTVLTFIGVIIGGTALIGLGFVGFMAYRRRQYESGAGNTTSGSTVIIDDGYNWHEQDTRQSSAAPSPLPPQPPVSISQPHQHNNSVYIDEEEPADMFDKK